MKYTRYLPHIQPLYETFFITFRIINSLPVKIVKKLAAEKIANENKIIRTITNHKKKQKLLSDSNKRYFIIFDELLHKYQAKGNLHKTNYAEIVKNSLHFYDKKNYNLISYCIMPNHVHLLISDVDKELYKIMQSIKSFTGKALNKLDNKHGKYWQRESYDHVLRKNSNINNYVRYIVENPVKARLVRDAKNWKHTFSQIK